MAMRSKARPTGATQAVSTDAPRRSERLEQARKRTRDAPAPSPAPAPRRQGGKQSRKGSLLSPAPEKHDQGIQGGGADDAEAEFDEASLSHLTNEEIIPYYKRLYKKRANMGLVWYHRNSPDNCYEFTSVLLKDVYNFMDGGICYMHMNFKARDVATGSEKLFFAELALDKDVFDNNSGYSTTACSIVDDNCVGGVRHLLRNGLPSERYDEKNCYVCAKEIKHPAGNSYRGGHYAEDYCVVDAVD